MIRGILFIISLVASYLVMKGYVFSSATRVDWWMIFVGVTIAGLGVVMSMPREKSGMVAGVARRHGWPDWLVLGCGIAVAHALFLLFFLHVPKPLEDVSSIISERFASGESQAARGAENAVAKNDKRAGNWLWIEQTIRPLPRRTDLKPGNQPEVFLQLADAQQAPPLLARRAYVGAFALGTYENATWMLTPTDTTNAAEFPQRPGKDISYEIFHPTDPSGQSLLMGLQGMMKADIEAVFYRGDGVHILPPPKGDNGYRYTAVSRPLDIEELRADARGMLQTAVPRSWVALPKENNFDSRLLGLCAEATSTGSLRDKLLQLRDMLRDECAYSLQTDNSQNIDPLENFLFHEKRGHCELFATAGALAARTLGVPSRVSYGWAGGSYYEYSNLFVFRAREAHAWTEVLIEDVGWVVMDCTPPASVGASRNAPPEEKPLADEDIKMDEDLLEDTASLPPYLNQVLIGTVIAGLALALVAMLMRNRSDKIARSAHQAAVVEADYVKSFRHYCAKAGLRLSRSDTIRRMISRLPQVPAWARELQRYHYSVRYGKADKDRKKEESLRAEIASR